MGSVYMHVSTQWVRDGLAAVRPRNNTCWSTHPQGPASYTLRDARGGQQHMEEKHTEFMKMQIYYHTLMIIIRNPEEGVPSHRTMYIRAPIISTNKQPAHSSSRVGFGVNYQLYFYNYKELVYSGSSVDKLWKRGGECAMLRLRPPLPPICREIW